MNFLLSIFTLFTKNNADGKSGTANLTANLLKTSHCRSIYALTLQKYKICWFVTFPVCSRSSRSRNKSSPAKTFLLLSFLSPSFSRALVRFVSFHPSRALWQTQFPTLVCPFRLIVDRGLSNGSNKQYGDPFFKSTQKIICGNLRYYTFYSVHWKIEEIEEVLHSKDEQVCV